MEEWEKGPGRLHAEESGPQSRYANNRLSSTRPVSQNPPSRDTLSNISAMLPNTFSAKDKKTETTVRGS